MVRRTHREWGFTYLWVLFLVALMGIALEGVGSTWYEDARRRRDRELQWVGEQYVRAIGSYFESAPGGRKRYPASLDELVQDSRFVYVRRHIRRLYVNPMTDQMDWQLVRGPGGGIRGVRTPDMPGRLFEYIPP